MADVHELMNEQIRRGTVLHASHGGVHCLRLVGDMRFPLAASASAFVDELLRTEQPQGFVIDLNETDAIDSTMLGVLARVAKGMRALGGPRATIVCGRDDINELLASIGFDEVFHLDRGGTVSEADATPVPIAEPDDASLVRTMIDAHRTLMSLNERNRELFRDVVVALEAESARTGVAPR